MMSLLDSRHVLVFGPNCLFQEVLDRLGLKTPGRVKPTSGAVQSWD